MRYGKMKKGVGAAARKAARVVVAATLACGLLPAAAFASPNAKEGATPVPTDFEGEGIVEGEILVQLNDALGTYHVQSASAMARSVESALDAESMETIAEATEDSGSLASVDLPEGTTVSEAVAKAAELPGVVSAQPNFRYRLLENAGGGAEGDAPSEGEGDGAGNAGDKTVVFDDAAFNDQYYLAPWGEDGSSSRGANLTEAWGMSVGSGKVTVAVLDTGMRVDHEDLQDNLDSANMWDAYNNTDKGTITSPSGNPTGDNAGHGTHVCGIVAASANNGIGIAGASANAKVLPIKVFDDTKDNPNASTTTLVSAYDYLLEGMEDGSIENLHVVNMSLGGYGSKTAADNMLEGRIDTARGKGVLTVCAGGNGDYYTNQPYNDAMYPSDFDNVLSVTALEQDGTNAIWSDFNDAKDISAPGVDILSCYNASSKSYASLSGTSMASPLVAGIASLLWAAKPDLEVDVAQAAIVKSGEGHPIDDSADPYKRNSTGKNGVKSGSSGAIDAACAIEYAVGSVETDFKTMSGFEIGEIAPVNWENATLNAPEDIVVKDKETGEALSEEFYTLKYANAGKVGTAKVTAKGRNGYLGSISSTYEIKFDLAKTTGLTMLLSKSRIEVGANHPEVIAVHNRPDKNGSYSLQEGRDYEVTFPEDASSTEGVKEVAITGIGSYMGSRTLSYTVGAAAPDPTPTPIPTPGGGDGGSGTSKVSLAGAKVAQVPEQAFTGGAIEPALTVTTVDGALLTEGTDYQVSYASNVAAGTAKAVVSGVGAYTGSLSVEFTIVPAAISEAEFVSIPAQSAGAGAASPRVDATFGGKGLVSGADFDVAYRNNAAAGIGFAVVSGKGNFQGTTEVAFPIVGEAPQFADVDASAWYAPTVAAAARLGLLSGYGDSGLFGPEDELTRGQVAIILARAAGASLSPSAANATPFVDNEGGQWYTSAVNWAYENGIMSGYADSGLVGPNDPVTREQLAAMICSWAEMFGVSTDLASMQAFYGFVDNAEVSNWAVGALAWAADAGVITGVDTASGKMAAPQATATRAEMATMALRAVGAVLGVTY